MLNIGVVALGVSDPRRAEEFWCQALGYEVRRDGFGGWATVLTPPGGIGTVIALQRSQTPPQDHPRVHLDLHAAVGQVLGELRAQTGESSQVGVLDGHEVVYVDRLESAHSLRLFTDTGRRVPVHCTSSGKVLLAYLSAAERDGVLRAAPMNALTPHTITSREQLMAELARVCQRGWAEAINEREIGIASIAAPVRDVSGEVVAAISIGVPLARCSVTSLRRLAPTIIEAAEAASRRLGWSGDLPDRVDLPDLPDLPGLAKITVPSQQRKEG